MEAYEWDSYNGADDGAGTEIARFQVLYTKQSTRKHKKWENDGILVCQKDCAILKSEDDQLVVCRSTALKRVEEFDDGHIVKMGQWEMEIQSRVATKSKAALATPSSSSTEPPQKLAAPVSLKRRPLFPDFSLRRNIQPTKKKGKFVSPIMNAFGETEKEIPLLILNPEDVDSGAQPVVVDKRFSRYLRDHQKEGVKFIYSTLTKSEGAILADDMGLGKSLQTIAAMWALMTRLKDQRSLTPPKCLVVVPSSLVNNWNAEFRKWFKGCRHPAMTFRESKDLTSYTASCTSNPFLIISYEMASRNTKQLEELKFDFLVCDEAHRVKNLNGNLRKTLLGLKVPKRLLLTGTPMQNDLDEFFSLLDFVAPGRFGTVLEFRKALENDQNKQINEEIGKCLLRRTSDVNQSHLPEKHEYIIFCKPSETQKKVQQAIFDHTAPPLVLIHHLRQLCNHPNFLHRHLKEKSDSGDKQTASLLFQFPHNYGVSGPSISESGKLDVLVSMLQCFQLLKECTVIVSNYTKTLDSIADMCCFLGLRPFRLDGSTAVNARQSLVNEFNEAADPRNIFLLSTKAGGVGLNLVGASRLILFDSDWNPANDVQAMARIWRDGQTRPCHIYRLITAASIEEKILQRQVKKMGLGNVFDAMEIGEDVSKFDDDELMEIFKAKDTDCETHDMCECRCGGSGLLPLEMEENGMTNDDKSGTVGGDDKVSMAELTRWRHYSPEKPDTWNQLTKQAGLDKIEDWNITFAFHLKSNF